MLYFLSFLELSSCSNIFNLIKSMPNPFDRKSNKKEGESTCENKNLRESELLSGHTGKDCENINRSDFKCNDSKEKIDLKAQNKTKTSITHKKANQQDKVLSTDSFDYEDIFKKCEVKKINNNISYEPFEDKKVENLIESLENVQEKNTNEIFLLKNEIMNESKDQKGESKFLIDFSYADESFAEPIPYIDSNISAIESEKTKAKNQDKSVKSKIQRKNSDVDLDLKVDLKGLENLYDDDEYKILHDMASSSSDHYNNKANGKINEKYLSDLKKVNPCPLVQMEDLLDDNIIHISLKFGQTDDI